MFSKKKDSSKGKGKALVDKMGLFGDLSDLEKDVYGDFENDPELEAELLALQAEDSNPSPKKTKAIPAVKPKMTNQALEMDRLIAAGLRDIPSDEDVSDTEDPDLLAELESLSPDEPTIQPNPRLSPIMKPKATPESSDGNIVALVQDRLQMYEVAHSNAKLSGDTSKARRLERGLTTLRDLVRKAQLGREINEEDIPPVVAFGKPQVPPVLTDPSPAPQQSTSAAPPPVKPRVSPKPTPSQPIAARAPSYQAPPGLTADEIETHRTLCLRQDQFKQAALQAKQSGDVAKASSYLKTYKSFNAVIKAFVAKQPIDLSQMPQPPFGFTAPTVKLPRIEFERAQASASLPSQDEPSATEPDDEEFKKLCKAPESAGSVLEALQQRREKYQSSADAAKEEQNSGKQRRMGRIVKQFDDAIRAFKAGKQVDYLELPCPPGFPPIPTGGGKPPPAAVKPAPAAATIPAPSNPQSSPSPSKIKRQTSAVLSRSEQNTMFLQERQLQFKKAALKAKHDGEIELAKKYLQQAHGFAGMIQASQAGLPVDMSNVPAPPGVGESMNLEFVSDTANNGGDDTGVNRNEMYKKLEQDLIQQIRTSTTNADHFTKLGDVSTATKFDKYRQSAQKDLDALKNAYTHGDPVPRFHYESRTFSMVQSCPELGDNDLEIDVVRGLNYPLPKDFRPSDLDTYVKYEFPFPKDNPQKGDGKTAKGTENPEYNHAFKVQVDRKSRVFNRIVQSKTIKLDVYYRRGFLKSDRVLGSVNIKLQSLDNKCIVHDSYDLMDGRKTVGGKLEVKLRIRNPFVSKQIEEVKEKWLIIDHFERSHNSLQTVKKSSSDISNERSCICTLI